MDKRPELNLNLDSETFRNYYYLKEELMKFCRDNGLPSSGNKMFLSSENCCLYYFNLIYRI